ncbi:Sulfhydrogenase subunit alpha [hydrothermal vent metagenome]|uniref:Sulfhydrogenase subunit alpha n=1 Tax=hydrothermal vent metagenome TaxID=652676 RepID=A0A3B1A4B1_9ZZZZ
MDRLENMNTFIPVVEVGSISGAADRLGVAKSAVSRRLKELEGHLGVELFHRTTRKMNLTDTGRTYYHQAVRNWMMCRPAYSSKHNIIARATEIYYGLLEAVRLLEDYERPASATVEVMPRAGSAYGCTEAPRGLLRHRYEIDNDGIITYARLVPPTSQNQARIEKDLRLSLETLGIDNDETTLRQHAEQVIRNYDLCISCATHFLDLTVARK